MAGKCTLLFQEGVKGTCPRDRDFERLEELVSRVLERMDNFITELHEENIGSVVMRNDISYVKGSLADAKADIKSLNDWRQRFDGAVKIVVAIPILCTVLSTALAVYVASIS
jgi:hypothetical protein